MPDSGRDWEVTLHALTAKLLGIAKGLLNLAGKSRPGCDIWPQPEYEELFPFCVEAKHQGRVRFYAAMDQARRNCKDGLWPLVVARSDGQTLVCLDYDLFLAMVKVLWAQDKWHEVVADRLEWIKRQEGRL